MNMSVLSQELGLIQLIPHAGSNTLCHPSGMVKWSQNHRMAEVGSDLGRVSVPPYLLEQGHLELAAQNYCHLHPPKQQQGKEKVPKHHVRIIVIQHLHLKIFNHEC